MRKWRIEDSAELYNINGWGLKYFSINDKGHVIVTPKEDCVPVDLKEIMDELQVRDITAPVLLRFPDILDNRIEKISRCFKQAAEEYHYKAENFIIYPIKVNQMKQVVEEIVSHGNKFKIGLEAGSKPELHAVLAISAALAGAAAAFAAARRVCPPQVIEREVPFHTGDGDVDEMLTGIQKQLDTLRALNDALPDPQLSAAMDRMEKAGRSILEVVEQAPAKAKQIRRFANYYLPDAVHVLEQYAAMARQGVRGENAAAVRSEVEKNVGMIAAAFEHQLDALYAAESMDLSADLAVLETLMKNQGL